MIVLGNVGCCCYRKIDISSATLTYDVENLPKHQFEILSEGKLTSVQASSNEVMIYWLTTLQVCLYREGGREGGRGRWEGWVGVDVYTRGDDDIFGP